MTHPLAVTLHASGAETASGTGSTVDIEAIRSCVKLDLVATALAGTAPTLAVVVETAPTSSGPWRTAGTFTTLTAVGKASKTIAELDRYVRAKWTLGGSAGPSFTFSLGGEAHQLYCQPSDVTRTAIHAGALADVSSDVLADQCLFATEDAADALNGAFVLPITAWGASLRGHTAARAAFYAVNHRGFDPQNPLHVLIMMNGGDRTPEGVKSATQSWFDKVSSGDLKPIGIVDQTPEQFEAGAYVVTNAKRGW